MVLIQRQIAGGALVVLAVAALPAFDWFAAREMKQPLDAAIRVVEDHSSQWGLRPAISDEYEVGISVVKEGLPLADSLVGIQSTDEDSTVRSEIDISWELWRDGQATAGRPSRRRGPSRS